MSLNNPKSVRFAEDTVDHTVSHISAIVTVESEEEQPLERKAESQVTSTSPRNAGNHSRDLNSTIVGSECIRKLLQTVIDSTAVRYLLVIAALVVLIVICDRFLVSQSPGTTATLADELRSLLSKKLGQALQEGIAITATTVPK